MKDRGAIEHRDAQATPAPPPAQSRPRCPRCRYDMRTATEGWHEACPVEGRCVECGLVFRWSDVLDVMASVPRWSVEFAPAGRWPWAALATWCLSAARPRFVWRRFRMAMPVHGWRLVAYVVAMLVVPALVIVVVGQVTRAAHLWDQVQAYVASGPGQWAPGLATPGAPGDATWPGRLAVWASLVSVDARSEVVVDLDPSVVRLLEQHVIQVEQWAAGPPTLDTSAATFGLKQICLPFSSRPAASMVWTNGTVQPLPSPGEGLVDILVTARETDGLESPAVPVSVGGALIQWILMEAFDAGANWLTSPVTIAAGVLFPPSVCIALWQLVIGAAVFVALPQTRRRAKVSWAHVGRVTALGAWVAVLPSALPLAAAYYVHMDVLGFAPMATGDVSFGLFSIAPETGSLLVRLVSVWAIPVLLWFWWWLAAKHYLKLPHAWGVALAQAVIATAATLALYQVTLLGVRAEW